MAHIFAKPQTEKFSLLNLLILKTYTHNAPDCYSAKATWATEEGTHQTRSAEAKGSLAYYSIYILVIYQSSEHCIQPSVLQPLALNSRLTLLCLLLFMMFSTTSVIMFSVLLLDSWILFPS